MEYKLKNCESLCCIPITYTILYINKKMKSKEKDLAHRVVPKIKNLKRKGPSPQSCSKKKKNSISYEVLFSSPI